MEHLADPKTLHRNFDMKVREGMQEELPILHAR
jgi:hypothetical protein